METQNNDFKEILVKLTTVGTLQGTMHDDIKEIKKDVKEQNSRVAKLESCKADKSDVEKNQKYIFMFLGGISLLAFIVPLLMKYIFKI